MLEGMFSMAWYGSFGGGAIGNTLAQWEQAGFFAYVLPFLLIFALVFGILSQMKLFEKNKGVNGIIAIAVALMALQFDMVPRFFAEFFPRFGVGLAVILVAMIFLGMFMPSGPVWIFFGIGVIVFLVVLIQTFGGVGWSSGYWFKDNWQNMLLVALILGAIIAVWAGSGKTEGGDTPENDSILSQLIRGDSARRSK